MTIFGELDGMKNGLVDLFKLLVLRSELADASRLGNLRAF